MADGAGPDGDDLEAELRELYAVEPADFVAARTELVRRLRAAKRREEATAVAQRRRPSLPAWALDRVAREQPELIERALVAGGALRAATEAAVGGDAVALRRATAEDRAASDAVVDSAVGHLGSRGPAARSQVAATLRAAVLDDEVAADLRRGLLAADHDAPGFGWSGFEAGPESASAPPVAERPKAGAKTSKATTSKAKGRRPATDEHADAEAEAEAARERAAPEREEREERERSEAQERRAGAEAELAALEEQAAELARAAEQAEAEAREARADADAAVEAVRAARAELDTAAER